jgi:hypothetical protein
MTTTKNEQNDNAPTLPQSSVGASCLGLSLSHNLPHDASLPNTGDPATMTRVLDAFDSAYVSDDPATGHRLIAGPSLVGLAGTRHSAQTANRSSRAAIDSFSDASRRRLLRTAALLDYSVLDGSPIFITLTYPRDWRSVCPSGRVAKSHLLAFRKRYERRWGTIRAIWKLETQPRPTRPVEEQHAPHFHLFTTYPWSDPSTGTPIDILDFQIWTSRTWYEIVGSGNEDHLKAGTQVQHLRSESPSAAVAYFAGYFAPKRGKNKDDQHIVAQGWSDIGRFWGVWGIPRLEFQIELTYQEFVQLRRVLRHLTAVRQGRRPISARARRKSPRQYEVGRREPQGLWTLVGPDRDLLIRLLTWIRPATAELLALSELVSTVENNTNQKEQK